MDVAILLFERFGERGAVGFHEILRLATTRGWVSTRSAGPSLASSVSSITAPRGRQPEYPVGTDGAEFTEPLEKQDSDVHDARSVSKGGRWYGSRRRRR